MRLGYVSVCSSDTRDCLLAQRPKPETEKGDPQETLGMRRIAAPRTHDQANDADDATFQVPSSCTVQEYHGM
jgi:hypothetical protein